MEETLSGIDPKLLTKQAAAVKAVQNLDFKRGCRKIALEAAVRITGSQDVNRVKEEADIFYKWLLKH
jgi:hypothetical protein